MPAVSAIVALVAAALKFKDDVPSEPVTSCFDNAAPPVAPIVQLIVF